jgi:hypothetical protein
MLLLLLLEGPLLCIVVNILRLWLPAEEVLLHIIMNILRLHVLLLELPAEEVMLHICECSEVAWVAAAAERSLAAHGCVTCACCYCWSQSWKKLLLYITVSMLRWHVLLCMRRWRLSGEWVSEDDRITS